MYNCVNDEIICTASRDNITVVLENLNEGYCGDYNPDDPEDENLLRFTVYKDNEQVDDASYCTLIPVKINIDKIQAVAEYILNEIYWPLHSGHSIKKLCERLSHLTVN